MEGYTISDLNIINVDQKTKKPRERDDLRKMASLPPSLNLQTATFEAGSSSSAEQLVVDLRENTLLELSKVFLLLWFFVSFTNWNSN